MGTAENESISEIQIRDADPRVAQYRAVAEKPKVGGLATAH
ncbi:hypothetical protein [Tsukamurella sp. NPDC003166]